MQNDKPRIQVVDALRGFALVAIMLVHNLEHFEFYFKPEGLPAWLVRLDQGVWDSVFFLFGGKAYAIFALLFGVTFAIQAEGQRRRGHDFRGRFAWRLCLLFGFGALNSMFYQGDILMIYAVLGFVLIPFAKVSNRVALVAAVVLMAQPYEWWNVFAALPNPTRDLPNPSSWAYFGKSAAYFSGPSLLAEWWGNLTNGRVAVLLWTWEVGRVFQTMSLFLLGLVVGRLGLFRGGADHLRFWKRALLVAVPGFVVFHVLRASLGKFVVGEALTRPLGTIVGTWANAAFTAILVAGFVLLFAGRFGAPLQRIFAPFGRMSLSNYVLQSLLGTIVYHGFGFGLYRVTGSSACLLIGIGLAALQWGFCVQWLKYYAQGPLENLWHRATWVGRDKIAPANPHAPERLVPAAAEVAAHPENSSDRRAASPRAYPCRCNVMVRGCPWAQSPADQSGCAAKRASPSLRAARAAASSGGLAPRRPAMTWPAQRK